MDQGFAAAWQLDRDEILTGADRPGVSRDLRPTSPPPRSIMRRVSGRRPVVRKGAIPRT